MSVCAVQTCALFLGHYAEVLERKHLTTTTTTLGNSFRNVAITAATNKCSFQNISRALYARPHLHFCGSNETTTFRSPKFRHFSFESVTRCVAHFAVTTRTMNKLQIVK